MQLIEALDLGNSPVSPTTTTTLFFSNKFKNLSFAAKAGNWDLARNMF